MNANNQLQIYRGVNNQQGYGIGSIFAKLFRAAKPLIQKGAKYMAKNSLKAGYSTINDIIDGVPPGEAIKSNVRSLHRKIKKDAKKTVLSGLKGRGLKRTMRDPSHICKKPRNSLKISKKQAKVKKGSKKNKKRKPKKNMFANHLHGDLF